MAEAAIVAGEARYTKPSLLPMRPLKLRLLADTQFSPAAIRPLCTPRHAPQVGARMVAPASARSFRIPSSSAYIQIRWEAGDTSSFVPLLTFLPLRILAAVRRSLSRPPVQLPR